MAEEIALDFAPTELIARRLRRIALISAEVGLAAGLVSAIFVRWQIAVLIGVVIGAPVAVFAYFLARRRMWLSGNVIHATRAFSEHRVDLSAVTSVEISVLVGRYNQVSLVVGDATGSISILLAIYMEAAGRELGAVALRKLADGLAASELVSAAAVASVLIGQLRAEARDAVLGERPLYRALALARDSGRTGLTTLSDSEVAGLTV